MVAVVAGKDLGLFNASPNIVGGAGVVGQGGLRQTGARSYVNASNGNLVLQGVDEILSGRGADLMLARTYNSQGDLNDSPDSDGWLLGGESTVKFSGAANQRGLSGTVTRMEADGHKTVYTWNATAAAYLSSTHEGGGADEVVTYDSAASQWVWTDGSSRLEQRYEPSAANSIGRLKSQKDTSGHVLDYDYDGTTARLLTVTDRDSAQQLKMTYATVAGTTKIRLTKLETLELTVDGNGRAQSGVGTALHQVDYGYDSSGRLTTVSVDLTPTDNSDNSNAAKLFTTTYTYKDASFLVASITQSDGTSVSFTYDGSNRVASVADAQGFQTFSYAAASGNLATTNVKISDDAAGTLNARTWTYTYNVVPGQAKDGQLAKIESPAPTAGAARLATQFNYDAQGNLSSLTDAVGNTVTYLYDSHGNRTSEVDAYGNTVTRTYDSVTNQLLTETHYRTRDDDGTGAHVVADPLTTRLVYDGAARLRFVVSADGRVSESRYGSGVNDLGLLTQTIQYAANRYDLSGLGITAALTETQLNSWLTSTTAPIDKKKTQLTQYEYDLRGNLSKRIDFSKTDASGAGQLSTDAAATVTSYIYDGHGALLKTIALRGSGRTQATELSNVLYDGLGRETSRIETSGAISNGARTTLYDDAHGKITVTANAGIVSTAGLVTVSSYDNRGRLTSVSRSDGTGNASGTRSTDYGYDLTGRQRMVQDAQGARSFSFYDDAGRLLYQVDSTGAVTGFTYNADSQLTGRTQYKNRVNGSTSGWVTGTTTTDSSTTPPTVTTLYTVTKASLVAGTDFSTDSTLDRVTSYSYDAAGRLSLQTDAGNVATRTLYDGASRVVQQQTGDRVTRFFYDNDGNRTGTLDPLGYLTENSYDAANRLIGSVRYSTRSSGMSDASGPVWVGVTNQAVTGGKPFAYRLQAFDADGDGNVDADNDGKSDGLLYTVVGTLPGWLSLDTSVPDAPTLKGTPPAGTGTSYTVTVRADDRRGRTTDVSLSLNVVNSAPVWGEVPDKAMTVNALFSFFLPLASDNESTSEQLTYSIDSASLPPGMTFNAATRNVTGTPTTRGTYLITARVADPQGLFTDKTFILQVNGSGASWANAAPLPTATRTSAVSFTVPAALPAAPPANQTLTYSKVSGPSWLSFTPGTLTLSGTPPVNAALGPTTVVLKVRDALNVDVRLVFSVNVLDRVPTWQAALPAAQAVSGAAINYTPPAAVDPEGAALTYTALSGLPIGLSVNPTTGAITGTSSAVGGFVVVLRATDAQGAYVDNTVSLILTPVAPSASAAPIDTTATWRPATSSNDLHSYHYYDGQGRLVGSVDERGFLSETVYDGQANTQKSVSYLNVPNASSSDTLDDLKGRADTGAASKLISTTLYDSLGRVSTVTGVDGSVSHSFYDTAGRLVRQVTAEGSSDARTARTRYDAFNEVTGAVGGEGSASLSGNPSPSQISLAISKYGTRYEYDKLGRVSKVLDANPSGVPAKDHITLRYYDNEGRLTHSVNALGEVSETAYNSQGEAITQRLYSSRLAPSLVKALQNGSKGLSDLSTALISMLADPNKVSSFTYDKRGQLATSTDALGLLTTYTYDAFGDLAEQTRTIATGKTVTTQFGRDLRGQLLLQTGDAGGLNFSTRMRHDAFGRAVNSVDAAGRVTTTDYTHDSGRTIEISDPLGRMTHTEYDAFARVLRSVDARGQATTYAYNDVSRTVTLTLPVAEAGATAIVVTTTKNAYGQTVSVQDGRGNTTSYAYNKDGQLTTTTDALTHVVGTNTYDKNGLLSQTTDARGVVTSYTYDEVNRLIERRVDPSVKDPNDATKFTYVGLDLVCTYTFDPFGQKITTTEGKGDNQGANISRVTAYEYDLDGRQTLVVTDPGGLALATTFAYDGLGDTVQVSQGTVALPNQQVTQFVFNKLGQRVKEIAAPSAVFGAGSSRTRDLATQYRYDAAGRVSRRIDANGQSTWYVHDAAGQLSFTIDPLGAVSQSVYDPNGRLVQSVRYASALDGGTVAGFGDVVSTLTPPAAQPGDQRSYFILDNNGRQRFMLQAQDGGTWAISESRFDNNGNVIEARRYDKFLPQSRIAAIDSSASPGITMAEVATELTTLGYVESTPATLAKVQRTRMAYNADNQLRFSVDSLGSVSERVYDIAGNVVSSVRYAARPTLSAFTESAIDTAVNRADTGNQLTHLVYDLAGRLHFTVDPLGSVSEQTYDALGRVVISARYAERPTLSAFDEATIGAQLDFTDTDRHQVSIRKSTRNQVIRSVYDPAGRVCFTLQSQLFTSWTVQENRYDARGNVIESRRYDKFLDETAILAADSSSSPGLTPGEVAAQLVTLGYDDADETTLALVQRTRFAYNAANQLRFTVDALGSVAEQAYDATGNVIARVRYAAQPVLLAAGETAVCEATLNARVDRTNAANQVTRLAYDNRGQLRFSAQVLASDTTGRATQQLLTEQQYDTLGQKVKSTAFATPLGQVSDYSVATLAGAVTASNADRVTGFAFDAAGHEVYRARALTNLANGVTKHLVSRQSYDALGRMVQSTAYAAALTLSDYNKATIDTAVGDSAITGDAQNRITELAYDPAGQLRFVVAADGTFSETVYNALGQVGEKRQFNLSVSAPTATSTPRTEADLVTARGAAVVGDGVTRGESYGYDTAGNLTSTTDAAHIADSNVYNALGERITHVDKNGAVWQYTYDRLGRMRQQTAPPVLMQLSTDTSPVVRAMRTLITYDALGNLTSKQEATTTDDERVTRYHYDRLGRQDLVTLPGFYDATLGQFFRDNPSGSSRRLRTLGTSYDTLGNAVSTALSTGPGTFQYEYKTYDNLGRVVHDVDPLGNVTAFAYNSFDDQSSITRFSKSVGTVPPGGVGTAWTASAVSAALTALGTDTLARSETITYDTLGRKTEVTKSTVSSYYESGAISDAATVAASPLSGTARTVYEYDNFGQLHHQAIKLDDSLSNADNTGRGGHWRDSWHYFDVMGRETRSIDSVAVNNDSGNAFGYFTDRSYDKFGNLDTLTEYANTNWAGTSGVFTPPAAPETSNADRITQYRYDALNRQTDTLRFGLSYFILQFDGSYLQVNNAPTVATKVQSLGYDNLGHVTTRIDDPDGTLHKVTTSVYDAAGHLISVTDPERAVSNGSLDPFANQVTAALVTTFLYNGFGQAIQQVRSSTNTAAAGATLVSKTTYDAAGYVIGITDANGNTRSQQVDFVGRLIKETQNIDVALGSTGRMTHTISHSYAYDAAGHQTHTMVRFMDGSVDTQTGQRKVYNAFGEVTDEYVVSGAAATPASSLTSAYLVTHYSYDNAGQLSTKTDGEGLTRYYYNLAGQVKRQEQQSSTASSDGTSLRVTELQYDLLGRMLSQRLPVYTSTETPLSGSHSIRKTVHPVVIQSYDRWGNVFERVIGATVFADGGGGGQIFPSRSTRYEYNADNKIIAEHLQAVTDYRTDVNSGFVAAVTHATHYDALGRQVEEVDSVLDDAATTGVNEANANLRRRSKQFNAAGQLVSQTDATLHTTLFVYDINGNRVGTKDAQGHVFVDAYDSNGNLLSHSVLRQGFDRDLPYTGSGTPVSLQLSAYTYDQANRRVISDDQVSSIVFDGGKYERTITRYDERSFVRSTSLQRVVVFDSTFAILLSDKGTSSCDYDAFGNKTSETDVSGVVTTRVYSQQASDYSFGRLTSVTTRNAANTVTWATAYGYTGFGQLSTETYSGTNIMSGTNAKQYTYFDNGSLKGSVYQNKEGVPGDSIDITDTTDYEYNTFGEQASEHAHSRIIIESDQGNNGPPVDRTFDRTTWTSYDPMGRVNRIEVPQSALVVTYRYDELGNRREVESTIAGKEHKYFAYDAEGRMTIADGVVSNNQIKAGHNGGATITYDDLGRRRTAETFVAAGKSHLTDGEPGHQEHQQWQLYRQEEYSYDDLNQLTVTRQRLNRREGKQTRQVPNNPDIITNIEDVEGVYTNSEARLTDLRGNVGFLEQYTAIEKENGESDVIAPTLAKQVTSNLDRTTGFMSDQEIRDFKPDGHDLNRTKVTYHPDAVGQVQSYTNRKDVIDGNASGTVETYQYVYDVVVGGLKERSITVTSTATSQVFSTFNTYNSLGQLGEQVIRNPGENLIKDFFYDGQGHISTMDLTRVVFDNPSKPVTHGEQDYFYAQGQSVAMIGTDILEGSRIDSGYTPISTAYPNSSPGNYTVAVGDTLGKIARAVYGDSALWYVIADANGLSFAPNDPLQGAEIGRTYRIPTVVGNVHNNASTFTPYDPASIIGGSTVHGYTPPHPPSSQCVSAEQLIVGAIVIAAAVVATVYTAGAASPLIGQGLGLVAGAVAGSAAGQLADIALTDHTLSDFSGKQLFEAGITAGFTAGLGTAFAGGGVLSRALGAALTYSAQSAIHTTLSGGEFNAKSFLTGLGTQMAGAALGPQLAALDTADFQFGTQGVARLAEATVGFITSGDWNALALQAVGAFSSVTALGLASLTVQSFRAASDSYDNAHLATMPPGAFGRGGGGGGGGGDHLYGGAGGGGGTIEEDAGGGIQAEWWQDEITHEDLGPMPPGFLPRADQSVDETRQELKATIAQYANRTSTKGSLGVRIVTDSDGSLYSYDADGNLDGVASPVAQEDITFEGVDGPMNLKKGEVYAYNPSDSDSAIVVNNGNNEKPSVMVRMALAQEEARNLGRSVGRDPSSMNPNYAAYLSPAEYDQAIHILSGSLGTHHAKSTYDTHTDAIDETERRSIADLQDRKRYATFQRRIGDLPSGPASTLLRVTGLVAAEGSNEDALEYSDQSGSLGGPLDAFAGAFAKPSPARGNQRGDTLKPPTLQYKLTVEPQKAFPLFRQPLLLTAGQPEPVSLLDEIPSLNAGADPVARNAVEAVRQEFVRRDSDYSSPACMSGACGIGREGVAYYLERQGIPRERIFINQMVEVARTPGANHAFVVLNVRPDHNVLIDPTFAQFTGNRTNQTRAAEAVWNASPVGQQIRTQLLENGHMTLTPEVADVYARGVGMGSINHTVDMQDYMRTESRWDQQATRANVNDVLDEIPPWLVPYFAE